MNFREPKDTEKVKWTIHAKEKMKFYVLSETRLKRVLRSPDRIEEGIAPRTIAAMQRSGSSKKPSEIWLMYQRKAKSAKLKTQNQREKRNLLNEILEKKEKIVIISAWRYPGISPKGRPPIPEDIIKELQDLII
jgi:hypothetical protein